MTGNRASAFAAWNVRAGSTVLTSDWPDWQSAISASSGTSSTAREIAMSRIGFDRRPRGAEDSPDGAPRGYALRAAPVPGQLCQDAKEHPPRRGGPMAHPTSTDETRRRNPPQPGEAPDRNLALELV